MKKNENSNNNNLNNQNELIIVHNVFNSHWQLFQWKFPKNAVSEFSFSLITFCWISTFPKSFTNNTHWKIII